MAETLSELKTYTYICIDCGKKITSKITNAPKRIRCRTCEYLIKYNGLKVQSKGTIEQPEIGDVRIGREIGRGGASHCYSKFIFIACEICSIKRWKIIKRGKPESIRCQKCKWEGKKGKNSPHWINTDRRHVFRGYVMVRLSPDDFFYPTCSRRGWVFEHRLVMARYLGRNLHLWEIVHHKNHIRDDNRIENLQLISDDKHKQFSILETKIDRLLAKQDELMTEIKLLRLENKQLKENSIWKL